MDALITGLLKTGAPWGLLCAALSLAVVALWKRHNVLVDKLEALSNRQVEVNTETRHDIQHVLRGVDDLSRRINVG